MRSIGSEGTTSGDNCSNPSGILNADQPRRPIQRNRGGQRDIQDGEQSSVSTIALTGALPSRSPVPLSRRERHRPRVPWESGSGVRRTRAARQ